MNFNNPKIPYVIALKEKNHPLQAVIFDNEIVAIWLQNLEHKTYRTCSNCQNIHKNSKGALPSVCPQCNAKMLIGSAARKYISMINSLVKEGNTRIFFVNKNTTQ